MLKIVDTPESFKKWRNSGVGLTQKQLGYLLGVHHRTIQKWELGETTIPWTVALACALVNEDPDRVRRARDANFTEDSDFFELI